MAVGIQDAVSLHRDWRAHLVVFALFVAQSVSGVGSQVTIVDDSDPSVVYNNSAVAFWVDQTCPETVCSAKPPDLSQVVGGTWHDVTVLSEEPSLALQMTFTGVLSLYPKEYHKRK